MNALKDINIKQKIRSYFKLDTRNAILKKEIIGGFSTFLAMAYILAVNPAIISVVDGAQNYLGGIFLATAISSFIGTFIMGLYANIPIAVAPGMGLNAFFANTVAKQLGFESALTVTILSGLFYFIVVLTPIRKKMLEYIPSNIKIAISAAIGLFIAYLGLQNAGIIVVDGHGLVSSIGNFGNGFILLGVFLLILTFVLYYLKIPGSIIISMIVGAILLVILISTNTLRVPNGINSLLANYHGFSTYKDVVSAGWLGFGNVEMWKSPMTYMGILSFLYMDFFDTTGTLLTLNRMVDLDSTDKRWFKKANVVDASSTIIGGAIGATTVTTYIESTVGISAGAKTGIASIVTAICFGLSIALWPIIQVFMPVMDLNTNMIFQPITSPILVLIGCLMISELKHFDWKIHIDIPSMFITLLFTMLSNSIGEGMSIGIIMFTIINFALGIKQLIFKNKKDNEQNKSINYLKRINWIIIFIFIFSIIYFIVQTLIKNSII